jgi:4a-hydroxytetrahydrobiopterin dehydratase
MLMNSADIANEMTSLDGWSLDQDLPCIHKAWVFDSFPTAMAFFAAVGGLAESADHHPECLSSFTHFRIRLWTHDAKGLTMKDFELARRIDKLVELDYLNRVQCNP